MLIDYQRVPIVIWGLRWRKHSHRFIHSAWYWTLKREGMDVTWVEDSPKNVHAVKKGSVVFTINVASSHLPIIQGVTYVGHNLSQDVTAKIENSESTLLRLKVWTNESLGTPVEPDLACVTFDKTSMSLSQPWGTPFPASSWNRRVHNGQSKSEFWIGSIWNDDLNQGNAPTIAKWRQALKDAGVILRKVPPGWPDRPIPYAALIRRSRFGSSIVGDWQRTHEYLPCRVFKNASAGVVPSGNNPAYSRLFGDAAIVDTNPGALISRISEISSADRQEKLRSTQHVLTKYTYESGLDRILALSLQI